MRVKQMRSDRRGCRTWLICLLAIQAFLSPGWASAQETAVDYVEPRVTRQQFIAFIQKLNLDANQRTIAELSFGDFSTAITELIGRLDSQAIAAGRKTVQDALAGKTRLVPDDLKRMRVAVLEVYRQGWPDVDEALDELINGVAGVLTPDQNPLFESAARELRRDILLHPRQSASDDQEYAGDGVDVLALIESAASDGGELQAIDPQALQDVRWMYEQELDAILLQTGSDYRAAKMQRKIAAIQKDSAAARQQEQTAVDLWKRLYELNSRAVRQIGEIAASTLGEPARDRWLDRFDRASFTWLFPRKKPDRQIEWIRRQNLETGKLEQAEGVYASYVARRRALAHQAIDLMVRGRLEFQTMLYSMMDPAGMDDRVRRGLYEELLKSTGEQANLETTTSGSLESLLTEAQREAMRDALKKPDPNARKR